LKDKLRRKKATSQLPKSERVHLEKLARKHTGGENHRLRGIVQPGSANGYPKEPTRRVDENSGRGQKRDVDGRIKRWLSKSKKKGKGELKPLALVGPAGQVREGWTRSDIRSRGCDHRNHGHAATFHHKGSSSRTSRPETARKHAFIQAAGNGTTPEPISKKHHSRKRPTPESPSEMLRPRVGILSKKGTQNTRGHPRPSKGKPNFRIARKGSEKPG